MSERDLLFNRFSQASPRTHIQYGGNGLGLFISRRLAELQGGAIGFSSNPGSGSTFSFYVKARRSMTQTPRARFGSKMKSENGQNVQDGPQLSSPSLTGVPIGGPTSLAPPPSQLHVLVVEGMHTCTSESNLISWAYISRQHRQPESTRKAAPEFRVHRRSCKSRG
jgi:hypothetical protein